jgi:tetratricopeptide (TPR) repeat protein
MTTREPDLVASTSIEEQPSHEQPAAPAERSPAACLTAEPADREEEVETWLARAREGESDEVRARLAELEARLRQLDEHATLIDLLLGRAELSQSTFERTRLLSEVARLYEHELDDPARAFTVLLACDAAADRPLAAREELERLADRTGRVSELVDHLSARVERVAELDRADAWVYIGRLCVLRLGDHERALKAAESALALEPSHEGAIALKLELLHLHGRPAQLAEALGAAALAAPSDTRRAELLLEQVELLRQLGEPSAAKAACRQVLAADPGSNAAEALLEKLIREQGDLDELLDLLDGRALRAADAERLALRREAAARCAEVGRPEEAVRRYEEIRAEVPADVDALHALDRLYGEARPREQLEVLSALAGAVEAGREQVALYQRLAAGWEAIGETGRAAEAYEWLIAADGGDTSTFEALGRLYRADGRWRAAVEAASRHAERAEPVRRASLYFEIATIFEEHIEDLARAIDFYERANELAPRSEATLVALGRLYEQSDQIERAVVRLEEAAQIARTASARIGRLTRAATLLSERLGQSGGAERLFREVLVESPGYPPAARALAARHLQRGEHRAAADLLTAAVMHAADTDERIDLLLEAGQAEERLGEDERAHDLYQRALETDPTHRGAQVRTADLCFTLGRDQEALALYERLCEDEPDTAVRAGRLVRIGHLLMACGERARALEMVRRAQVAAPSHFGARCLEGELLFAEGLWPAARDVLAEVVGQDGAELTARERAHLHARLGACALELEDATAALPALEQALRLDPDHLFALKRALDTYCELGRWLDGLAAAERIAALEPDTKLRARYRHIAARICFEELHCPEQALGHYQRALEEDPELGRAAEGLEQILSLRGDRAELVAHYTRRIQQLGPAGDDPSGERVRLWTALADSCEAIGDRESTRIALEVATTLDGSHLERRLRLADLCTQAGADHLDRAVLEHQTILLSKKGRVASYRALAELYEHTGRPARGAACAQAAQLLVAHGLAEGPGADQPQSVGEPGAFVAAQRSLTAQDWAQLRHPDEDPFLSALFATVAPVLAGLEAMPRRGYALDRRLSVDMDDPRPFARACEDACRLLGVLRPELYLRFDQPTPVAFINTRSGRTLLPVFVVGTPMLGDRRRVPDLVFSLALRAANLRPERFLRLALPDRRGLTLVLEAVMALARESDRGGKAAACRTTDALRQQLTPLAYDQMVAVGRRLYQRGDDAGAAAHRWLKACDLTAARAALALTGDLAGAARLVDADDDGGLAEPGERVRDLLWSSVTDGFWAVRERLTDGRDRAVGLPPAQPARPKAVPKPKSAAAANA